MFNFFLNHLIYPVAVMAPSGSKHSWLSGLRGSLAIVPRLKTL